MAHPPKIRNIAFRYALAELKRAGVAPEPLLFRCKLRTDLAEDEDGWIPFDAHAQFLEYVAEAIGDPFLGLHAIQGGGNLRDFGALMYVGRASGDLLAAIQNIQRYLKLATEAWRLTVTPDGDFLCLDFNPERPEFQSFVQATEFGTASLIAALREFVGPDFAPAAVHFAHARTPGKSETVYRQILGCNVEFQRNQSRVFLDKATVSLPIGTGDPKLLAILKHHCDNVLSQTTQPTSELAAQVRQAILELMPDGRAQAAQIAGRVGLSERTLHRRLAEQNLSFRELLDDLRHELALAYIMEGKLSLRQVAYLLGYSDQSSFNVAFKRWTGTTPRLTRKQPASRPE